MKKDRYANINTTKRYSSYVVIAIAVVALCLAGILYVAKLQEDSGNVFLETGSVNLGKEVKGKG